MIPTPAFSRSCFTHHAKCHLPITYPCHNSIVQAMAPDLRRKVDANRAARLAREEAMKKQTDVQVRSLFIFFLPLPHFLPKLIKNHIDSSTILTLRNPSGLSLLDHSVRNDGG